MLEVKNVFKTYRPKKGPAVHALQDVSLSIEDTGLVFILGKSGSGKSTLLNVLGGLDNYDEGEILVKGKSSKNFSQSDFDSYRNTFIGFIFQEYNILDEFTVGQNIALAIELQGLKATSEAVNKILDDVDLSGYANRKPNELSGGQKQRVAIARALIKSPEIIMADEPTGALDSNTGKMVFNTLKKLAKTKLVLVVSHDRESAEQYGDRVIELADGKIISDIKKYVCPPKNYGEGISVVDNKIIHVKDGYLLTQQDMALINYYITHNSGHDTFISFDRRTNAEAKRLARIDESGNREAFADTTPDKLRIKRYESKDFHLIRSRLPYKNSVKIGASSLKSKPARLVFTILLSAIAFCLFGITFAISGYEKNSAAVTSLQDASIKYVAISKSMYIQNRNNAYYSNTLMTDNDAATLREEFPDLDLVPVYKGSLWDTPTYSNSFAEGGKLNSSVGTNLYNGRFCGFTAMTDAQLEAMGYTLQGRLPAADDEIAITKHALTAFELAGYVNSTDSSDTVSASDIKTNWTALQGKTLQLTVKNGSSNVTFKIVGVVDTGFDTSRYSKFLPAENTSGGATISSSGSLGDTILAMEMDSLLSSSPHTLAFVKESFLTSVFDEGNVLDPSPDGSNVNATISSSSNLSDNTAVNIYDYYVVPETTVASTAKLFSDAAKTNLNKNGEQYEVLADTDIIGSWYYLDGDNYYSASDEIWHRASEIQSEWLSEETINKFIAAGFPLEKQYNYPGWDFGNMLYADSTHPATHRVAANTDCYVESQNGDYAQNEETPWSYNLDSAGDYLRMENYTFVPISSITLYSDYALTIPTTDDNGYYNAGVDGNKIAFTYEDNRYKRVGNYDYVGEGLGTHVFVNARYEPCAEAEGTHHFSHTEEQDEAYFNHCRSAINDYLQRVATPEADGGYETNAYFAVDNTLPTSGKAIMASATSQAQSEFLQSNTRYATSLYLHVQNYNTNTTVTFPIKIVGFYSTDDSRNIWILPDALIAAMDIPESGKYSLLMGKMPTTTAGLNHLVDYTYEDGIEESNYLLNNAVSSSMEMINDYIETLASVFLYVGLGFAVFAALLLMNFISTSISYKKREIGILRAVGARSTDVVMIFFNEALIIALINFFLAAIGSATTCILLNKWFAESAGLLISILGFGIKEILYMLLLTVGVAFISSSAPVLMTTKKRPIDAIRDN